MSSIKFTVNSQTWAITLGKVKPAVPAKSMIPIIEGFKIDLKENQLLVTGTDLDNTVTSVCPCESINDNFSFVAPTKILDILKALSEQPITIIVGTDNYSMEILTDNGKYKIACESAENYPQQPNGATISSITIGKDVFLRALQKTAIFVSNDIDRAALNCVYMQFNGEGLEFVATDAHKLAKFTDNSYMIENQTTTCLVYQKTCQNILKSLNPIESVNIEIYENRIVFTSNGTVISARLCDQKYPNYRNVIPADNDKKMVVERQSFLTALKRAKIFTDQISKQVAFELSSTDCNISAENLDYGNEAKEAIKSDYVGNSIKIGFNVDNLIECISQLEGNTIQLEFSEPNRATIITSLETNSNENYLLLCMPILLSK